MIEVTTVYACDFGPESVTVSGSSVNPPDGWQIVTLYVGAQVMKYLACPQHSNLRVVTADLVVIDPGPMPVQKITLAPAESPAVNQ